MKSAIHVTSVLVALLAVSACQTMQSTPIDEPSTLEGLQRVDVRGVDAVYRKPTANLSGYNKLLVRPVEIAFSKSWKPQQDSALYRMNQPDRDQIKKDLADAFADVMKRELETEGGYHLVSAPAADVLEVRPAIINLYITAPDVSLQTSGRSRTYTTDAGEMTLVAELHDSVTGELLSRAFDRQQADSATWEWTNSVTNTAEAKQIIARWADALRDALNASRGQ